MNIPDMVALCPGLQFMPILANKAPAKTEWQKSKRNYDFTGYTRCGIVCGDLSGNVEAIDFDLKYDLTKKLYSKYKQAVQQINPDLLAKMVVQKTVSNGYHFIYRCPEIEGNKKLARRPANEAEKQKGEKVKVLIETRGEGGYIACWPTPGYELVYGSFDKIQTITPDERAQLFNVAHEFNEFTEEFKPEKRIEKKQIKGLSPFEDFNNRADVVGLLEKHGWKAVGQKGSKTLLLRPGDTSAKHSGNYDAAKNWFSVFSTSTQFEEETAYLPYAVYAFLECNKDFSEASKRLYAEGFGDRIEKAQDERSDVKSRIDTVQADLSFLATENDYLDYLASWRRGTFEMGLKTGFHSLDDKFRFKRNLVVINGHDNVGKSVFIWYMALLSALLHGWKWVIFSSENSVGSVYRKLIEFYWCKEINEISEDEYKRALKFAKDMFYVIISDDELYNYKDILNMAKIIPGHWDALLIDPYNGLKIELTSSSKLSTHEYHYEALSDIKLFGKRHNKAIYVNCHAVTNAIRQKGSDGLAIAPQKADTEGGGKFANKADDFLTLHRKTQHIDDWDVTEIHVRKIKETETGGRVTPYEEPIKLRRVGNVVGFKYESLSATYNPILEYHNRNKGIATHVAAPGNEEEEIIPF